jgi:hypothetical protein
MFRFCSIFFILRYLLPVIHGKAGHNCPILHLISLPLCRFALKIPSVSLLLGLSAVTSSCFAPLR